MTNAHHEVLDWSGLEIMGIDDCYEQLRRVPIGRLGLVDHGEPVILPVNFGVDGRSLVFRTAEGSKLSAAIMQQPVCLQIDEWDLDDHSGWSVLVKGMADHVLDEGQVEHLETLAVRPWSHPELRHQWVRLVAEEVSGRRIAPGSVDDL